jgi:hypothetical protein
MSFELNRLDVHNSRKINNTVDLKFDNYKMVCMKAFLARNGIMHKLFVIKIHITVIVRRNRLISYHPSGTAMPVSLQGFHFDAKKRDMFNSMLGRWGYHQTIPPWWSIYYIWFDNSEFKIMAIPHNCDKWVTNDPFNKH